MNLPINRVTKSAGSMIKLAINIPIVKIQNNRLRQDIITPL